MCIIVQVVALPRHLQQVYLDFIEIRQREKRWPITPTLRIRAVVEEDENDQHEARGTAQNT